MWDDLKEKKLRYFRIKDDCGFIEYVCADEAMQASNIALLTPHVRTATEISKEEYEAAIFMEVHKRSDVMDTDKREYRECCENCTHYAEKSKLFGDCDICRHPVSCTAICTQYAERWEEKDGGAA